MSHSHYQTTLTKTNTYVFVTESGHTYEVYFDNETCIFPDSELDRYAVFLGFNCSPPLEIFNRHYDPKIGETIMHIVAGFFKAYPLSILTYVCSSSNGQGRHRQISFSRWHTNSFLKEKYKLAKRSLGTTYCGILYSFNHPEFEEIDYSFMDFDESSKPGVFEKAARYYRAGEVMDDEE